MAILFSCPDCGKTLRVGDNLGGKRCKCPSCGVLLDIPRAASLPPPPAAARGSHLGVGGEYDRRAAPRQSGISGPDPYEDDAPPRPRRRKKNSNKALVLGLTIGGCGAVLLGGVVLVLWLLVGDSGLGRERDYFPDDFTSVECLDYDAVRKSGVYAKMKKNLTEGEEWGGIRTEDVRRKFEVRSSDVGYVVILELKKPASAESIKSSIKGVKYTETTVGQRTLHEPTGLYGEAFVIDGNLVAYSSDAEGLRKIVGRGGKARCNEKMQAALKKARFSGGFTRVTTTDQFAIFDNNMEYVVFRATFDSSNMTGVSTIYFKDSKDAAAARDKMQKQIDDIKKHSINSRGREVWERIRLSQSGASVTWVITIPMEELGGVPFFPF